MLHHLSLLPATCLLLFSSCIPQTHAFAASSHRRNSKAPSNSNPDNQLRLGNSIQRREGVIVVDVENVRGKSGFALSHQDLFRKLGEWTKRCQISGQVILVADHGNSRDAYWTANDSSQGALAVVFSGNSQKADDVIANDLGKIAQWSKEYWGQQQDDKRLPVMVVTDDQGLLSRCRKTTARKALEIITPLSLLEELDQLDASPSIDADASSVTQNAQKEIAAAAEWMLAFSKVRAAKHKHIPNKRRKALSAAVSKWQQQLEGTELGREIYHYARSIMDGKEEEEKATKESSSLHPELQTAVVTAWERLRETIKNSTFRKEKTGDRVVLAEEFRKELNEEYEAATQDLVGEQETSLLPPAQRYIKHWSWTHASPAAAGNSTLRMVVISDTHGFEQDLPPLPKGDVLLHLGDFALEEGNKDLALEAFDQWLSEQPHPHKIVLRGNHDPRRLSLDRSGAQFVTSPRSVTLGGFSMALVPFMSRLTGKCLPPQGCDVVASHVPPRGVLDKCLTGKLAGCHTLKKRLQQMDSKGRPKVVLCGHIHECRGFIHHSFVHPKEKEADTSEDDNTLVLNAANANPGIAESIEYGPVVVQLARQRVEDAVQVEFQMAEDGTGASPLWELYDLHNGKVEEHSKSALLSTSRALLTVRLGLRSGISLFNDQGELLCYKRFQFPSVKVMGRQAQVIIEDFEDELRGAAITHVALVGGDGELRQTWQQALAASEAPRDILEIGANEWRSALLTKEERQSSRAAKTASRAVALQVISKFTVEESVSKQEKLPMEVAESILAGFYVSHHKLGMIQSTESANGASDIETTNGKPSPSTLIHRLPNGAVVVN